MTPFELAEPKSLRDAAAMLRQAEGAAPIAGGTAIMLMMKTGVFQPAQLVSLRGIEPHYSQISLLANGSLRIGAMASLRRIEQSADVADHAPVIVQAMQRLANVRVRNAATIGGALAHGDPHLDLPPVLIALDAAIAIAGEAGERTLAVEDLFRGYLETALACGELIASIEIPAQGARRAVYVKHTTRSADDWPALGLAISADLSGSTAAGVRAAIGAATDTPRRLPGLEAVMEGRELLDDVIERAGEAAAAEAEVHSDARGSAPYKRELIRVFARRAIRQLAAGGKR